MNASWFSYFLAMCRVSTQRANLFKPNGLLVLYIAKLTSSSFTVVIIRKAILRLLLVMVLVGLLLLLLVELLFELVYSVLCLIHFYELWSFLGFHFLFLFFDLLFCVLANRCFNQKNEIEKKFLFTFPSQEVSTDTNVLVKHLQVKFRNYVIY